MFTDDFAKITTDQIAASIRDNGYFTHPAAITPEFIDAMRDEIGPDQVKVNHNGLSPVCFGRQFYLNQVLAQSNSAYDLIMSDTLLDVAENILGDKFRLTTKRYYTTHQGHAMAWHRDNKIAFDRIADVTGLIWIFYLTDVTEGAFQFVRNSHQLEQDSMSAIFPDDHVQEKYQDDIISFEAERGAMIVYNISTIHRARPFSVGGDFSRTSLFVGMMAEPTLAEPVFVNTSFCSNLTERQKFVLGFGKKEIAPAFPETNVKSLDEQSTMAIYDEIKAYKDSIGL